MKTTPLNLLGQIFGRLTVVREGPRTSGKRTKRTWDCLCECGRTCNVLQDCLISRHTQSCGCYRKENTAKMSTTHGMTRTPEYYAWQGMSARCFKEYGHNPANYKDRGITVCRRWRERFEPFFADMGVRPSSEHSIDRIDNNGNYSCGKCEECVANGWLMNCRWATPVMQGNNTRANRLITAFGQTRTLSEWAQELDTTASILAGRLNSDRTSVEDALTIPIGEMRWNSPTKLTKENVLEIRHLYSTTKISKNKLGKMFGVAQPTIDAVITRRTWNHV